MGTLYCRELCIRDGEGEKRTPDLYLLLCSCTVLYPLDGDELNGLVAIRHVALWSVDGVIFEKCWLCEAWKYSLLDFRHWEKIESRPLLGIKDLVIVGGVGCLIWESN